VVIVMNSASISPMPVMSMKPATPTATTTVRAIADVIRGERDVTVCV